MKRTLILGPLLCLVIILSSFVLVVDGTVIDSEQELVDAVAVTLPYEATHACTALPTPEVKAEIEPNEVFEEAEILYYTEEEVVMVAKLLYRECGGVPSDTEKACVAWTVCNRVDSKEFDGSTVTEIVTADHQFAYRQDAPVEAPLYELAEDVLSRWNAERNGKEAVGRVLPPDYTFFSGDGEHNYFRNKFRGGSTWDYSMESPYES